MNTNILFSIGRNTYDNQPQQRQCTSPDEFFKELLADRSVEKGQKFVCGPIALGTHDKPEQYPGEAPWRLKKLALPRRFLAFDIDHCQSAEDFLRFRDSCEKFLTLIYTTASHQVDSPRFRAIVILDEELNPNECEALGRVLEKSFQWEMGLNAFKFDSSTYQPTQPVFTPLIRAEHWVTNGQLLNVSAYKHLLLPERPKNFLASAARVPLGAKVAVGGRNQALLSHVGRFRRLGMGEEEILAMARSINQTQFEEPMPENEVESICSRYAQQGINGQTPHTDSGDHLIRLNWLSGQNRPIPRVAPPPREYTFGRFVTPGTLAVLGGQGGSSKTMLAMQLCAASACGESMGDIPIAEGCSLLVLGEEDDQERDRRLGGICSHFGYGPECVEERVLCIAAAGVDIRLTQRIDSNAFASPLEENLIQVAKEHALRCGVPLRFIVVDHARLVLGGDPNNAEDVTQLTRVLTNIAKATGASVLLLAHSPKSVLGKLGEAINAADIAGSSAFVDNSRTSFMAYGMREDEAKHHLVPSEERGNWVRLQNVKANYAPPGGGWWLKRVVVSGWDIAVLEQKVLPSNAEMTSKKRSSLRLKVIEHLRKFPGASRRSLRDRAGRTGVFGASERELMVELDRMLEEGLISQRAPDAKERKQWGLTGQVREVLILNVEV
jgi:RecA-family ATPase